MKNHCNENHRFTNLHERKSIDGVRYVDMDADQKKEYMRQRRAEYRAKRSAGVSTARKIVINGVEVKYKDMTIEQRRIYVSQKMAVYRAEKRAANAGILTAPSAPVGNKGLRRAQTNEWLRKKLETIPEADRSAFLEKYRADPTGLKKLRYDEDPYYRYQMRAYAALRKYDLTLDQITELNKITHCQLCGKEFTGTIMADKPRSGCYPCIDHLHNTSPVHVRGVLCNECNKHVVEPLEKFIQDGVLEKALAWINRPAINDDKAKLESALMKMPLDLAPFVAPPAGMKKISYDHNFELGAKPSFIPPSPSAPAVVN